MLFFPLLCPCIPCCSVKGLAYRAELSFSRQCNKSVGGAVFFPCVCKFCFLPALIPLDEKQKIKLLWPELHDGLHF